MSAEMISEGAACRPNFSASGRRRRKNVAIGAAVFAVVLLGGLIVAGASWPVRLVVALPAMMAAITGLQVTRNTCVAHAATGSFENEDFSLTKVDEAFAAASRRVAATIYRDGVLTGVVAGALAAATSFVR